ncbi:UNVERIFIED_CONTAM: hypothetical protein GTU68_052091 [Idotea baltica]|nr:hypothetical protein [Idotea baltica]
MNISETSETTRSPVTRALISVSDKTNIIEFAQALTKLNIEILSTGGTYQQLKSNGIKVTEVADYTQFPEIMNGRVKTLHPKIHGGILGRRNQDKEIMMQHHIQPIDLVIVNLYPFEQAISMPDCTLENAIENIDIGGPTMIRSAAKNHNDVGIVVHPSDYSFIIEQLNLGGLTLDIRFNLACKAFEHTAAYDGMIANYLGSQLFPDTFNTQFFKKQVMRYGENPHQLAAFYTEKTPNPASISSAIQLQGKALSFNNVADTDTAIECVKSFTKPACVIVKHANPCGVSVVPAHEGSLKQAYLLAYETDKESAFGGIIAFNRTLDKQTAEAILERQFVEVIVAPAIDIDARAIISTKKNIRLLEIGSLTEQVQENGLASFDFKRVNGGLLVQSRDTHIIQLDELRVATKRAPSDEEMHDLIFAWKVAKFIKSNAIVYAKNRQTIGVGAGQMSRINSARIAAIKAEQAQLAVSGAVMASDAFFPFRDGIDNAAQQGITAVIQPGGSIRDDEVITAANEANIAMIFTGIRHFRH